MRISKFIKGSQFCLINKKRETDEEPKEDNRKETHPPNPNLIKALQGLSNVVCKWMMATQKSWGPKLTIRGLSVEVTEAGTRSVSIHYALACEMQGGGSINYSTPLVRIDKAEDGEDDKPIATPEHRGLIENALRAIKDYDGGSWQPGTMGTGGADPEEGTEPKTEPMFDDDPVAPE